MPTIFTRKPTPTVDTRLDAAHARSETVLDAFASYQRELTQASEELAGVAAEAQDEADRLTARSAEALASKDLNDRLLRNITLLLS